MKQSNKVIAEQLELFSEQISQINPKDHIPNMIRFEKPSVIDLRKRFIKTNFDLRGLKKTGLIQSTTDMDHIVQKITTFFGYETIYEYGAEPIHGIVCYCDHKHGKPEMPIPDLKKI